MVCCRVSCAEDLKNECAKLGAEAHLEAFQVDWAQVHTAALTADGREIPCKGYLCAGSGSVEAPLYYLTDGTDYAEIAASDLRELKAQFPELADIEDITELDNPIRYAGLRDLGLTPREAYLATSKRASQKDNRSHLSSAMPKGAGAPRGGMSREELYRAREIFGGMSDVEIQALYRKVNV